MKIEKTVGKPLVQGWLFGVGSIPDCTLKQGEVNGNMLGVAIFSHLYAGHPWERRKRGYKNITKAVWAEGAGLGLAGWGLLAAG